MYYPKKEFYLFTLILMTICIYTGCASKFKNVGPPEDFLQKKGGSIGLVWTSVFNNAYPAGPEYTAKHVMMGNQGLLDIAVAHAFSDKLLTQLSKIKINDLMMKHYFNLFSSAFEDNGFTVKIKPEPYCYKKFRLGTVKYCDNPLEPETVKITKVSDSLGEMPIPVMIYNFKPVIEELGVDYLMVVDLIRHGTGRTYFSMVPTSPPKGTTQVIAYLIDGKSMEVISKHISSVVEPAKGDWDEPPEYSNLMAAVRDSFEIAMDDVFINIFKQAP